MGSQGRRLEVYELTNECGDRKQVGTGLCLMRRGDSGFLGIWLEIHGIVHVATNFLVPK